MERKIGEIFEYNGEWYQCVEGNDCANCVFIDYCKSHSKEERDSAIGLCVSFDRNDGRHVIFKKLEKVGELMKIHNRLVLKVKADAYKCMRCCLYSKGKCELTMQECEHYDCGEENKFIEIKQNKEDMEEKKLNLKPFDIQKAREGKPVCTRDGRKARIICFDRKGKQPIIALVIQDNGEEFIENYCLSGRFNVDDTFENDGDLMMLPEKKEGWVNVYKGGLLGARIYSTKEEAINNSEKLDYIDTIRVEWEE